MPTYLTDKIEQSRVSPRVKTQETSVLEGDPVSFDLPKDLLCSARTPEAAKRLCTDLGIKPIKRTEVVYEPGDVAIVGSLSEGPTNWARHTFSR